VVGHGVVGKLLITPPLLLFKEERGSVKSLNSAFFTRLNVINHVCVFFVSFKIFIFFFDIAEELFRFSDRVTLNWNYPFPLSFFYF
jgi:hypothetical protein